MTSGFSAHHKDVVAEWFVAKVPGTIDTIYWEAPGSVGAKDSLIEVHINRSNIYPGRGPGYPPYRAPCSQWGYYRNANDLDQGITPYRAEATDTQWISTTFFGDPLSFDPLGADMWLGNGFKFVVQTNSINIVAMDEAGDRPRLNTGDAFFISFRVNSFSGHPPSPDKPTEFAQHVFHTDLASEHYPSRNWVFYEHDSGPSYCGQLPGNFVRQGWIALGSEFTDSLEVAPFNIWYSMTVDTNLPYPGLLEPHLDVQQTGIGFCMTSCNPSLLDTTTVTWVQFSSGYAIDSLPIQLTHDSVSCTFIPSLPQGSIVSFRIGHRDSHGAVAYGPSFSMTISDVESTPQQIPGRFALYQNYPNPFNPTTTMSFVIGSASGGSFVTLEINDVLGREVATLVNERKEPGEHTVIWDATKFPSGVYFYKLTAGSFLDIKKLLLIK